MKPSELLVRIRAAGGEVGIVDRNLAGRNVPVDLEYQLKQDAYYVKALLREERAERAWEASGHNPQWWRTYKSDVVTEIDVACFCNAKPYPHCYHDRNDPIEGLPKPKGYSKEKR